MRLESVTLRNFKSIGSEAQSISFAPITLLFGPNSVGKSTVLQSLVYLREIIKYRNLDPDKTELGGEWLDLGGFLNLIYDRDPGKIIEIRTGVTLSKASLKDYLNDNDHKIITDNALPLPEEWLGKVRSFETALFISWSEALEAPIIDRYEVFINEEVLGSVVSSKDCKQINIDTLNTKHQVFINGPDMGDEETRFHELFEQAVDNIRIRQPRLVIDDIISGVRPFKNFKIDELNKFVDTIAYDHAALEKVLNELEFRTTRTAYNLRMKIKRLLEEEPVIKDTDEKYIGLTGQKDALLNFDELLQIDPEIWDENYQDEYGIDKSAVQLLISSILSGLFVAPLESLSILLNNFTYIGPLRDLPQREMIPQRTPDPSRWAKGLAAWELLYAADSELIKDINKWLGDEYLDTGYEITVKKYRELGIDNPLMLYLKKEMDADSQNLISELINDLPVKTKVSLREINTNLEVLAQDIGVGISQLIPVIILSIFKQSGIISIEQPELHIHPRLQVELADLFIAHSKEEGKIFLLETHSEHIMLRLLRRIREYYSDETNEKNSLAVPKEYVSVIYVESTDSGAKLTQQLINEEGDFDIDWPDGFFEERDPELFF